MAVSNSQKTGSVPPAVVAVAVAVVVGLAAMVGYKSLSPAVPEIVNVEPSAQAKETSTFVALKAKESGGDINKLSPADRDRLQMLTRGHGEQALKGAAKQ